MKSTKKYPFVRRRMIQGLILVMILPLALLFAYFRDTSLLNRNLTKTLEHPFTVSNSVRDITIYINAMQHRLTDLAIAGDSATLYEAWEETSQYDQLVREQFNIVFERYLGNREDVSRAYDSFLEWGTIRDEVIKFVLNNQQTEALSLVQTEGEAQVKNLEELSRIMIEFANRKAVELNTISEKIWISAARKSIIYIILSFLIIIPLVLYLFIKTIRSVDSISRKAMGVLDKNLIDGEKNSKNSIFLLDRAIDLLKESELELREKVAEQNHELKDARDLLAHTINIAPTGLIMISPEGKYLSANRAFCHLLGYTENKLKKISFHHITHEEDIEIQKENLKKLVEGKAETVCFLKRYISKKGESILCSLTATLVKDTQKVNKYFFIQVQDVTLQTMESEKLSKYKDKLEYQIIERTRELNEKANSLEKSQQALTYLLEDMNEVGKQLRSTNQSLQETNQELEGFSYSVSHDLRAPLRAIDGYSRILMQEYVNDLDDEARRLFTVVIQNTNKMQHLIDDILALSRLGRRNLNLINVDLDLLVKKLVAEFALDKANSKIQWKLEGLPEVYGDPGMINQLFINILSNSIKFSSHSEVPLITIGSKKGRDGRDIIYIEDNGVGFDMKYVDKIFEVFQRLHSEAEFEGTGIGLAIAHRIIKKHHGTIVAESKINLGTTVSFSFNLKP